MVVQGKEAGTPGPPKEGTPKPKELEVTAQPGKLHCCFLLHVYELLLHPQRLI